MGRDSSMCDIRQSKSESVRRYRIVLDSCPMRETWQVCISSMSVSDSDSSAGFNFDLTKSLPLALSYYTHHTHIHIHITCRERSKGGRLVAMREGAAEEFP